MPLDDSQESAEEAKLLFVEIGEMDMGFKPPVWIGEVAERFNAAVLKTVDSKGSGGSNPSLSANIMNLYSASIPQS